MQTRAAFHLWPRLHQDLLRFLDLAPEGALGDDLAPLFRHVAAVEEYWRRVILEPDPDAIAIDASADPTDRASLRARLEPVFAATERLLDASLAEALVERPIRSRYPVRNALEALTLCHLHTVHHRAEIASRLRALDVDPGEWI